MGKIIGIQFQENGKMYYFDSADVEVKTGDYVIVDTARGYDLGEVVMGAREIDEENWRAPLKKLFALQMSRIFSTAGKTALRRKRHLPSVRRKSMNTSLK